MENDKLRNDLILEQKKGLPFISASIIIWGLIALVMSLSLDISTKNILVFCCSCPMVPIAWFIGKKMQVDIFAKGNPLSELGLLFTLNQILYIIIVMWVYNAVPDKMVMVFAMVFGAHLLPYSWLYKSKAYRIFAILIPILSLILGVLYNGFVVAACMVMIEIIFVIALIRELHNTSRA